MTESQTVQAEQGQHRQKKTYEAPRVRHEGKWNEITAQLGSFPINP